MTPQPHAMSRPNPAIVTQANARPLARWLLLLVCATYLLPGQFGRDAWRHADLTAFGFMDSLADGRSDWLAPALGGQATPDGALLPYWLGASFIRVLPFLDPALAARLPFIALLAVVIALVWFSSYFLARTEAAQPVGFAFGGEAATTDYARMLADCAVLALVANLGLLQLGHETTPELVQLLGVSLWLYALSCAPFKHRQAQGLAPVSLLVLTLSGAAQFALLLGVGGLVICQLSQFERARQLRVGLTLGLALCVTLGFALDLWRGRLLAPEPMSLLRQMAWFTWPTAALAGWTIWRWRAYLGNRHISVPLTLAGIALLACVSTGGGDRTLLLVLPGLAPLAAFALPTLNRSLSAMVDWFSVFFFSAAVLFVWAYYVALQTGWPPQLLSNVLRLFGDIRYRAPFDAIALAMAIVGTVGWFALVRWRTSRRRAALWRSLVLPAGGTLAVWLLIMTLMLAPLNHARSNWALLRALAGTLPAATACVAAPGQNLSLVATLEALGGWTVQANVPLAQSKCDWAVRVLPQRRAAETPHGWQLRAVLTRPSERSNRYQVLERQR